MPRFDAAITRFGARWFVPRREVEDLARELAALSAANHRLAVEVERLSALQEVTAGRSEEVAALVAAQTEQMRTAVEDLLTRLPGATQGA